MKILGHIKRRVRTLRIVNNNKCDVTIEQNLIQEIHPTDKEPMIVSKFSFNLEFERTTQVVTGRSCIGQYGSQWCYEDDYDDVERTVTLTLDKFKKLSYDIEDILEDKGIKKFESAEKLSSFLDCLHDEYPETWEEIEEKLSNMVAEILEDERADAEVDAAEARAEARAEAMLDRYDY